MNAVLLTEDDLHRLEKRFGPGVRQMGAWISDGTFGYSTIPVAAVEKAVDSMDNPMLRASLPRLTYTQTGTEALIELLETYGFTLIDRIIAAYRQYSLESPIPPQSESRHNRRTKGAG
jgi:protein tyrosine phosphatase (PTP) superfamily phosphohydrolase (DUF442 family)